MGPQAPPQVPFTFKGRGQKSFPLFLIMEEDLRGSKSISLGFGLYILPTGLSSIQSSLQKAAMGIMLVSSTIPIRNHYLFISAAGLRPPTSLGPWRSSLSKWYLSVHSSSLNWTHNPPMVPGCTLYPECKQPAIPMLYQKLTAVDICVYG